MEQINIETQRTTEILNSALPDGGPLYTETQLGRFVAEPFNAVTAFPYLLVAIFWGLRIRQRIHEYPVFALCLFLLAVGGIGGTGYHAFRTSKILFLMDVVPIGLIAATVSLFFWSRILPKPWQVLPVMFPFFIVGKVSHWFLSRQIAISMSYCTMAALVLIPITIWVRRHRVHLAKHLYKALAFFAIAVSFRSWDAYSRPWFPMGTHWLWHLFSLVALFYLIQFLYLSMRSENAILHDNKKPQDLQVA